jgi:hypothetical protein
MEVADLEGTLLDYWVSRASGVNAYRMPNSSCSGLIVDVECVEYGFITYNPSSSWRLAGPIIEGHKISIELTKGGWKASRCFGESYIYFSEKSPLIAAMRCFVASQLGTAVSDDGGQDMSKISSVRLNAV